MLLLESINLNRGFHSGVYFAEYPALSAEYSLRGVGVCLCGNCGHKKRQTKKVMTMFLAKVLVGRCTNCNSTDRRPPKNKKTGRLFDSTKGYLNGEKVALNLSYVIFDAMQHYPEYVIEFIKETEPGGLENSSGKSSSSKLSKKATKASASGDGTNKKSRTYGTSEL